MGEKFPEISSRTALSSNPIYGTFTRTHYILWTDIRVWRYSSTSSNSRYLPIFRKRYPQNCASSLDVNNFLNEKWRRLLIFILITGYSKEDVDERNCREIVGLNRIKRDQRLRGIIRGLNFFRVAFRTKLDRGTASFVIEILHDAYNRYDTSWLIRNSQLFA